MRADDRRTMIQLGGRVAFVPSGERSVAPSNEARRDAPLHLPPERSLVFDLGEAAYRRSEQSWAEAGRPNARVALRRREHDLVVDIDVCKPGELTFVLPGAANPLDNEEPDINGDGVQLYVAAAAAERGSGWLLTPDQPGDAGGTVRARPIAGWPVARTVHGTWERTNTGYHVRVQVDIADVVADGGSLAVEVIVNEMPLGRTRRRGQLLLSGGAGEFVYLRGDRQDRERLTRIQLVP
jgi:hypothetical protein